MATPTRTPGRAAPKARKAPAASARSPLPESPAPAFAPIRARRVFDEICDEIRRRISRGEYRPGDKLPAERELAVLLNVSRQALREALRMLENAGVVVMKKGAHGGAFVREGDPEVIKQSLWDLMHLGSVSLLSMLEARALITDAVVPLACERATEEDFLEIERSLLRAEEALKTDDVYEAISLGTRFYKAIGAATHNAVLELLVNSLSEIVRYVLVPLGVQRNAETWKLRRKVLEAMRARDVARTRRELRALFDILQRVYQERERARAAPRAPAPSSRKA